MIYRFDDFELNLNTYTLLHQGEPQHLEPLVFDLIRYFVSNPGEVLSRDALMEAIWKNRIVSDATLSGAVKDARKALGDSGDKQHYIRTIRGRGFQFTANVHQLGNKQAISNRRTQTTTPSLIILPFDVFGNPEDLAALSDAFVENLTTILTRIPLLQIVSRVSSFGLKGKAMSAVEIRRQFGADFMLEGSLQFLNQNIRTNIQLIDTATGFHLWAQQFEHANDDDVLFRLLDEVVAKLEPQLVRAIFNNLNDKDEELNSKQLMLQAMSVLAIRGWHKDSFDEAALMLHRVIELDPELALARAYLALILGLGFRVGLQDKSREIASQAEEQAEIALKLDNMDSIVVGLAGCALADIGQPDRAIPLLEKAIELNPNNGHAWAALGSAQTLLGLHKVAASNLRKGINVSPADNRRSVWCAVLAMTYLLSGKTDEGIAAAKEGCRYDDRNYFPHLALAAAHLSQGDRQQAARALAECYRVKPDLSAAEIAGLTGQRLQAALCQLNAKSRVD